MSEARYRRLFEDAPIGIAFLSKQREITLTNQRYRDFLGLSEPEIIERGPVGILHPNDWDQPMALSAKLRSGEMPLFHIEQRYIRGDGTVVWAGANISALRDKDGRLIHTIAWVQDITERKRAEEEKARLQHQLTQAQKMESVGRLAGGVAHDFNNMLGVILGHAELVLEEMDPTHPFHASLKEIQKAAKRSADLTRQLLSFARKQTVEPKVLSLNETVETTLSMLQRLIGEEVALIWQPKADLWPVRVDPSQIVQILTNLSVNARDAIAGVGSIMIRTAHGTFDKDFCASRPGSVPGEYVLLLVSDNGCGMDETLLSHIFEPFSTTKGVGQGTVLGLATVYGVVKQNNGFISVESKPGHGTTFSVCLPRYTGKLVRAQVQDDARATPRGQETILVVEEEPANLKLMIIILEKQGYAVLAAGTPGDSIRLAREYAGEIDLLVTDVVMHEMNGRELAKHLPPLYPHIKFLFVSGYAADVIADHGVLEEGVSFIGKPFSAEDLSAKVRQTLERALS